MSAHQRPLSPHLQIYKPQLTSVMSITHRLTGLFLCLGAVLFVGWLAAIAGGPDWYHWAHHQVHTFWGQTVAFLMLFSFFYHMANGLRHLFWDIGVGFELQAVYRTGWMVIFFSLALTMIYWVMLSEV